MAGIPLPESSDDNEWLRAVADGLAVDEQALRAAMSAYSDEFRPAESEREAALEDVITDVYAGFWPPLSGSYECVW